MINEPFNELYIDESNQVDLYSILSVIKYAKGKVHVFGDPL